MTQRAFITGITGQDGTFLALDLLDAGFEVHGLRKPNDRPARGRVPEAAILHDVDLRDSLRLAAVVREVAPHEIYNLAGQTSVAASWDDPVGTSETTGTAVATVAHAAWQVQDATGRPVRFVQASSAEIFGAAQQVPQNESTPVSPVSPYGAAKAFAHFVVAAYRHRGLHASSCILYNHESPLRPETFVTRKITASVARIARGQQQTLTLGSLDVSRDWGWAPDYVRAMQLAARADVATDFVIGTGVAHTVRDFVSAAFAAVGIDDWTELVSTDPSFVRPVDPPTQLADSSRAREVLGWQPTVGFDELVARMVEADLAAIDSA